MRNISAIGVLILLIASPAAQARDANDRTQKIDVNRDRSESRIERLREDRNIDKVRAEKPAAPKPKKAPATKQAPTPNQ